MLPEDCAQGTMGLRAPNPILVDQGRLPEGGDILPSLKELVAVSHVGKSWKEGYSRRLGKQLMQRWRNEWAWCVSCSQLSLHEWSAGPMKRKESGEERGGIL